jgi:hypothetical protein
MKMASSLGAKLYFFFILKYECNTPIKTNIFIVKKLFHKNDEQRLSIKMFLQGPKQLMLERCCCSVMAEIRGFLPPIRNCHLTQFYQI